MVTVYSWGWSGEKGGIVCRGVGEGVASMISWWCGRERRGGVEINLNPVSMLMYTSWGSRERIHMNLM